MNHFLKIGLLLFTFFSCDGKQYELKGTTQIKYSTKRQKKKLFKSVGCQYFNFMEIDIPNFSKINPEITEHYFVAHEMIQKLSKQYWSQVENYTLAPMYLQWISTNIGYGVFAAQDIQKDDFIGVYAGQLRVMRERNHVMPEDVDYAWYYPINTLSDQRILIDGKLKGNELRFINHDQRPNTKCIDLFVNGRFYMCYVATKNIAKDAQLTISYGDGYWDSRQINPEKIK
ncbi:SET domain-containing protein-lysine N-methyltransferase [Candidatus Babeliales bacterium]|nr:SET domain-containing protein-lysine N-methyltransferase [Candidatus Babeliales bacterium]